MNCSEKCPCLIYTKLGQDIEVVAVVQRKTLGRFELVLVSSGTGNRYNAGQQLQRSGAGTPIKY